MEVKNFLKNLESLDKNFLCRAEFFETLDSTNTYLKNLVANSKNPKELNHFVVCAETQTAGKGRLERKFYSSKGKGLYFSISCIDDDFFDASKYTASAAVGIKRALFNIFGVNCGIKWVNDIYLNGKKICGILAEGVLNPGAQKIKGIVIGCGINVLPDSKMPKDLKNKAGSVLQAEQNVDFEKLLASCVYEIYSIVEKKENVLEEYKNSCFLIGKTVEVSKIIDSENKKDACSAKVLEITDDFGLKVRYENEKIDVLHSGEITLHRSNIVIK